MPLYVYRCTGCKNEEEVIQTIKEMEAGIGSPNCCSGCDHPYERLMGTASIGICDTSLARDALHTRAQFDKTSDDRGPLYERLAKQAGIDTTGKWYHPPLARFLGDPEAWVGSMDDIKQRCLGRGWKFSIKDGNIHIEARVDMTKPVAEQTPNLVRT